MAPSSSSSPSKGRRRCKGSVGIGHPARFGYPKFILVGYDIGSGTTEAKRKTVPSRLKGSGMRWNLPNAEAMAAIACVDQSNMLNSYWNLQRQRVA